MRRTLIAGLIAATLMPVAAQAQYSPITPRERNEIRRDRQDVREERRDLDRAIRSGDPRAIREERRDLREERRDLRETRYDARTDFGRDDWRAYRNQNRGLYRGGSWRSDYGYQNFRPGARIGGGYYAPRYVIAEPWRYRLPRAGFNQRWVRHYNDVILVDTRRGFIVNVIRGFYY